MTASAADLPAGNGALRQPGVAAADGAPAPALDTAGSGRVRAGVALLTAGEVARLFGVDHKTVNRWARAGRLGHFRTPGNRLRFHAGEVEALLASDRSWPHRSALTSPGRGPQPPG